MGLRLVRRPVRLLDVLRVSSFLVFVYVIWLVSCLPLKKEEPTSAILQAVGDDVTTLQLHPCSQVLKRRRKLWRAAGNGAPTSLSENILDILILYPECKCELT